MNQIFNALKVIILLAMLAGVFVTSCQKLDFETKTKSSIENVIIQDANTLKVIMQITELSEREHADYGVCYSTSNQTPTINDNKVLKGEPGTIKKDTILIQNLQSGSKLFIRAFVMAGSEPEYSLNLKEVTLPSLPLSKTLSASGITIVSAILNGRINANNTTASVAFEYGTSTSYGSNIKATPGTVTGTENTSVSANLTGLQANTTYHCRVVASCSDGTSVGNDTTFTTAAITLPTVTTSEVTNITANSAVSGGNVTNDGGGTITRRGVCWSTATTPTIENSHTEDGAGTGSFVSNMNELLPATSYYVRAYATNGAGTTYGNQVQFTTDAGLTPTLSTVEITGITATTATGGGNITAQGGTAVTARGVCWSASQNPTISDNHTSDGTGTGTFTSNLTGLTAASTYYVRAYATNSAGTAYGNQVQFTTSAGQTPTVTTTNITNITSTTATGGGNVTAQGGTAVTARGVCWSTSQNPTIANNHTSDGTGTGTFSSNLTGLTAATTYYVRAYATNSAGTAYGNQVQFNTLAGQTPTVTTNSITFITSTTATGGGNVTAQGGTTVTARGVCWSTTQNPTLSDSHTSDGTGTGTFTSNITGLTAATTYYVRAYATNGAGTAYGNQVQFTTSAGQTPTVTTNSITNITATTATGGGNVTAQGGTAVTARGVCWSTTQNPTVANNHTSDGTGTGTFTSNITGLTAATTYYVRAYATNSAGTAYGNQVQFTTSAGQTPTVTTSSITNITSTTATGGGNVTAQGGTAVTARGVCWSTTQNPTIANSHTSNGTGTGTFTSNITGLTAATTYYVRAYATNSSGTAYGNQVQFTTTGLQPTVTTTAITNISPTSATGGGNVTAQGSSAVSARGVCWSTSQNPTIANNYTNNGTGTGSFTSNLAGLSPATVYYVRAYATNSAGTAYGNQVSFTTTSGQTPTVTTAAITNISSTTATGGGNVTAQGSSAVTIRGVCWSTQQNPTISNSYVVNGSGLGSFISNITGLSPSTTYYVRAFAINSSGTGYGNQVSFTTASQEVTLRYDNGTNLYTFGLASSGTFQISARFPASTMGQYTGMKLSKLLVFVTDNYNSCIIKIYGQGTPTTPGSLLYQQVISPSIGVWSTLNLTNPVTITGQDIWIGYQISHNTGNLPVGIDPGPANPNGDWMSDDGGLTWYHIAPQFPHNWNLAGVLVSTSSDNKNPSTIISRDNLENNTVTIKNQANNPVTNTNPEILKLFQLKKSVRK